VYSDFEGYVVHLLNTCKSGDKRLHEKEIGVGTWSCFYENAARTVCSARSFFTTENRYMGIGSNAIQNGDVVCVLLGGRVPYILRPQDKHYRLVGAAYVHGVMDGEVIEELRQGNMKEQVFEIR